MNQNHYDVVICGAGIAGLTLARQYAYSIDRDIFENDLRQLKDFQEINASKIYCQP